MRMNVSMTDLFESMDYKKIGDGTALYLSDAQGRVVLSSGENPQTCSGEGTSQERGPSDSEAHPQLGWDLITVVPAQIVEKTRSKYVI